MSDGCQFNGCSNAAYPRMTQCAYHLGVCVGRQEAEVKLEALQESVLAYLHTDVSGLCPLCGEDYEPGRGCGHLLGCALGALEGVLNG